MGAALSSKSRSGPRLGSCSPPGWPTARHTHAERIEAILRNCGCVGALPAAAVPAAQDSFAAGARAHIVSAGALSQTPSVPCSKNAPALVANIHRSLSTSMQGKDGAWAWVHAPRKEAPFERAIVRFTSCSRTVCRR